MKSQNIGTRAAEKLDPQLLEDQSWWDALDDHKAGYFAEQAYAEAERLEERGQALVSSPRNEGRGEGFEALQQSQRIRLSAGQLAMRGGQAFANDVEDFVRRSLA